MHRDAKTIKSSSSEAIARRHVMKNEGAEKILKEEENYLNGPDNWEPLHCAQHSKNADTPSIRPGIKGCRLCCHVVACADIAANNARAMQKNRRYDLGEETSLARIFLVLLQIVTLHKCVLSAVKQCRNLGHFGAAHAASHFFSSSIARRRRFCFGLLLQRCWISSLSASRRSLPS